MKNNNNYRSEKDEDERQNTQGWILCTTTRSSTSRSPLRVQPTRHLWILISCCMGETVRLVLCSSRLERCTNWRVSKSRRRWRWNYDSKKRSSNPKKDSKKSTALDYPSLCSEYKEKDLVLNKNKKNKAIQVTSLLDLDYTFFGVIENSETTEQAAKRTGAQFQDWGEPAETQTRQRQLRLSKSSLRRHNRSGKVFVQTCPGTRTTHEQDVEQLFD